MKKAILIVVLLVLIVAGYFVVSNFNLMTSTSQENNKQPPSIITKPSEPSGNQEAEVVIKNFAFNPATITIKKGTKVTWTNEDSVSHKIASDPHPAHTDLPELVSGNLEKGQSYSFTFNKAETWSYHCHLHPSMKGKVIVE